MKKSFLMEEKWKFNYVHRDLLRAWSDDGVHVCWSSPFEENSSESAETGSLYWLRPDPSEEDFIGIIEDTDRIFAS